MDERVEYVATAGSREHSDTDATYRRRGECRNDFVLIVPIRRGLLDGIEYRFRSGIGDGCARAKELIRVDLNTRTIATTNKKTRG